MEIFRGISLKDILEDDTIFRPKRRDLLKEENIFFHTNALALGTEQADDTERQHELDQYRKRFEEALVRIEDKEDVIAFQQARKEIDDEFDEEAAALEAANEAPEQPPVPQLEEEEDGAKQSALAAELDNRSANMLQRDLKKSEYIDWREHPTLNGVTKQCINFFEQSYSFDTYLDDRSKKDTKFTQLADLQEEEKRSESDFSMSEDEEEDPQDNWERQRAEELYRRTRDEIGNFFF